MAVYSVGILQFDDLIHPVTGAPFDFTANNTAGHAFEIRSTATPVTLSIDDGSDDGTSTGRTQRLSAPVTVNGTRFGPARPGATPTDAVAFEFGFSTRCGQSLYVVAIDGTHVGLTGAILPMQGQVLEITAGLDGQTEPCWTIPCFTAGTLVDTPDGPRAVETLRKGDLVETMDAGPQPLRHVTLSEISVPELMLRPRLRPVEIAKGALGNTRALRVSPQHAVLIEGPAAEVHFGTPEMLVPARALLSGAHARVAPLSGAVIYVQLEFAAPHLVRTEGMISESVRPCGHIATDGEVTATFGALPEARYAPAGRPVPTLGDGSLLAP